ncbi:hypothetical protein QBC47DRAFT_366158 [Echria macrotheca]|uniref:PD-(D/E)XK nuclease-like domain-containing protein n=1 Tax=Echria macrotheca TaxID=438768 RepID=A0AAJ0B0J0_9PEZI|nr:hypothetical protein QBC47DRAFT_366158 [Echria macrotheca]
MLGSFSSLQKLVPERMTGGPSLMEKEEPLGRQGNIWWRVAPPSRDNARTTSDIIDAWLQDQVDVSGLDGHPPAHARSLKRTLDDRDNDKVSGGPTDMSSPPKRPRLESPDGETTTPASSYGASLAANNKALARIPLRAQQSSSKASSRSGSPTKPSNTTSLAGLRSPVRFVYPEKILDAIPDRAGLTLWRDLMAISRDEKVLPQSLQADIEGLVGRENTADSMWSSSIGSNLMAAKQELNSIRALTRDTCRAEQRRKAETGWNEDVHKPALRLALESHPAVQAENVSTTRLANPFRPPLADSDLDRESESVVFGDNGSSKGTGTSNVVYHKIVDYVLVLDTDLAQSTLDAASYKTLAGRIKAFVDAQPRAEQWINAIQYEALRYMPAGVAIETKTNAASRKSVPASESQTEMPSEQQGDTPTEPPRIPALPIITVFNGSWELVLAVAKEIDVPGQAEPQMETITGSGWNPC